MRLKLVYILSFLVVFSAFAQTAKRNFRQREIGVFLGGSYYIGDINTFKHFVYSKPAAGIFFRYTTNYRYAFRFGFNYGRIAAADSKSKSADQLLRNASFRSDIYELHILSEFNFVEYRIGHNKHYFTMFIFAGVAGFHHNPQANIDNGRGWQTLQNIHTEGQKKGYPLYQFSIPFGIGFKYNLWDFMGIGLEWGPRKTFTDYLDDVSGLYPDPSLSPNAVAYTYPNKVPADLIGTMRGNPRTKDWYFYYGVSVNFKLRDRGGPCYGVNNNKYN
ncbi:MAG: hypothetical protein IPI93_06260 [Sphingobacteriaceae bacterium]|nr:hypothetical protein [Sphingobacteriaceae bacterium]